MWNLSELKAWGLGVGLRWVGWVSHRPLHLKKKNQKTIKKKKNKENKKNKDKDKKNKVKRRTRTRTRRTR